MSRASVNPRVVVVLGVLFVSSSAILIKFSTAPALVIASYRMSFTVLLMLPSLVPGGVRQLREVGRKDLLLAVASGVFLALHFATWITSLKHTSVASATILVNTHPVFIVILGFLLFRERLTRRGVTWMSVALAGTIVLALGGATFGGSAMLGNALAVAGALTMSGYMLIGRALRQRMSSRSYTFVVYLTSAIVLVTVTAAMGIPLFDYGLGEYLIFLSLAVFPTLLGHSLFNWSLKYLKTSYVSTAILGEPVFATVLAMIILGEIPHLVTAGGGAVVIAGIYLFNQEEARQEVRP